MAHINFLTVTYTVLIVLLICFGLSKRFMKLFRGKYNIYFVWLYMITIVELVILPIFVMYYQQIYNKRGITGELGNDGEIGPRGENATCSKCEEMGLN